MIPLVLHDAVYIETLERVLKKTDYVFFIKSARGVGDFIDPWYVEGLMKKTILTSKSKFKKTLLLLQMGYGAEYDELAGEIGKDDLELMIASGLWKKDKSRVETDNYIVLTYQGLVLVTEINPWYETCTNKNTNVYIGSDSLRLAENIVFKRGSEALDLCSGTGIQGLLAAKSAKRVVSVEMNPKAVPVTEFNIRLNHLEDIVELRQGNLYDVLSPNEKFDFIYANPPFIPVADGVVYPICGDGGADGRMVLDRIIARMPEFLKPGGEAIIFCECLGDEKGVFFDKSVEKLLKENGWRGVCLRNTRIGTEHQIERFLELIALFNDKWDKEEYTKKIRAVYKELGATFLYNLVYKIDAEGGDDKLSYIDRFNPWTGKDRAVVDEKISVGENKKSLGLFKDTHQVSSVSKRTQDVLEMLRENLTISQIASRLYEKQTSEKKMTAAALESKVEEICRNLELLGVLKKES